MNDHTEQSAAVAVQVLTRVVNVQHDPFDVYVGRWMPRYRFRVPENLPKLWTGDHVNEIAESPLGNPFKVSDHGLDGAIREYADWLFARPELYVLAEGLRGKTLGCWCAPRGGVTCMDYPYVCHGQVVAAIADGHRALLVPE